MIPDIYIAIDTPLGTRWVYRVPRDYALTAEQIRTYGICVAGLHDDRWQIHGTCRILDQRYIDILDSTPVFKP